MLRSCKDLLKKAKIRLKDCTDTCLVNEAAYTRCASHKHEAIHKVTIKAAHTGHPREHPQDPHTVHEQKRG